jgi:hypothetical protein
MHSGVNNANAVNHIMQCVTFHRDADPDPDSDQDPTQRPIFDLY